MNARVFLLVLFSSFFMTVWSADEKSSQLALARKARQTQRLALREVLTDTSKTDAPAMLVVRAPGLPATLEPMPQVVVVVREKSGQETLPREVQSSLVIATAVPFLASIVEHHSEKNDAVPAPVEAVRSDPLTAIVDAPHTHETVDSKQELSPDVAVLVNDSENAAVVQSESIPETFIADEFIGEETSEEHSEQSVVAIDNSLEPIVQDGPSIEPRSADHPANTERAKSAGEAGSIVLPLEATGSVIPLPKNLASGTWQVMTQTGEYFRITIDRSSAKDDAAKKEEKLEDSFCISTTPDGVRWCFIRSFVDAPSPAGRVSTQFFAPINER